jgi:hypothetical protein
MRNNTPDTDLMTRAPKPNQEGRGVAGCWRPRETPTPPGTPATPRTSPQTGRERRARRRAHFHMANSTPGRKNTSTIAVKDRINVPRTGSPRT